MAPLPSELPDHLLLSPNSHHYRSSYNVCLGLESKIESRLDTAKLKKDITLLEEQLINCRVLGLLLHHAPNEHARHHVHKGIVSCKTEKALHDLGKIYKDHYIRAFRANKGRTPAPSSHPSRPSFDKKADEIRWMLENAPRSHGNAKKLALFRDRYRCVITGRYDGDSAIESEELLNTVMATGEGYPISATELAHIIPESTNDNLDLVDKAGYATTIWTILQNFGYPNILNELNGKEVHRLENVFTCDPGVHKFFDSLEIWMTATEIPHQYKLEARSPVLIIGLPKYITLDSPDPDYLPPPSPDYLALHAACARVAHLSGAAKYIDKTLRDLEEIRVLAEDGASAHLLEHALYATGRAVTYAA